MTSKRTIYFLKINLYHCVSLYCTIVTQFCTDATILLGSKILYTLLNMAFGPENTTVKYKNL